MMNVKGVFSHASDDWSTPEALYHHFVGLNGFFDPCPLHADFDGLSFEWPDKVFVNPPYSDVLTWVRYAMSQWRESSVICMLLPVRTDTQWFRELCGFGCDVMFFRGRLKFGGIKNSAPFPSMLVWLNRGCFDDYGRCRFSVENKNYYGELD